jgi:cell division protein ZapA
MLSPMVTTGHPWRKGMKVKISVRGRKYTVRSDDEDVDLVEVAKYVDGKMQEISQRSATFDEYTIAMLAALNIASEFERFKKEVDEELRSIDRELASTTVLLEASLPVNGEAD